ncbi:hypothetical protein K443DRAFT_12699 [Laccaria amethystina LaAM-08-1]|uniref:Uncharacterized protein n=1 Tax=Laccaria amethystina LaAM-08-1 TaxID=1095629 RepID=A0A0C9X7P8_9AGAR|nr:hypothetical protein K443DRAFT_12699 [Laccaria amethystina LaAM-08-1]
MPPRRTTATTHNVVTVQGLCQPRCHVADSDVATTQQTTAQQRSIDQVDSSDEQMNGKEDDDEQTNDIEDDAQRRLRPEPV